MTAVIVLGMHRSGTSLVASTLDALGVHMGDHLLMAGKSGKAHYEDWDFINLNTDILKAAGGQWDKPPNPHHLLDVEPQFRSEIAHLLEKKNERELWGWKDPRTSLTIWLYRLHLWGVRYVVVQRNESDTITSLCKRGKNDRDFWREACLRYWRSLSAFLQDRIYCVVEYEELVNQETARSAVERIAEWVGGDDIDATLERIE
jgi:hypothetical protein